MGLLDAANALRTAPDPQQKAARELEAMVLKQVLASSGAFRGSEAAGSAVWSDLLAEAVAGAVSSQGGLGLADVLQQALPHAPQRHAPTAPLALVAGHGAVTSPFGERVDPLDGTRRFHPGVDVAAPEGTPILAAADGVVLCAGPRGDYGNAVELRHADGSTTLYGHASALEVAAGQVVRRGEPIARVGSTGRSTGNHLHFEVRRGGHSVDPTPTAVRAALQVYGRRADGSTGDLSPAGWKP